MIALCYIPKCKRVSYVHKGKRIHTVLHRTFCNGECKLAAPKQKAKAS